MRSGRLRKRLAVQSATLANATDGQAVKTWATDNTVWGSVEPLRGTEREAAQQVQSSVTHKIVIRHSTDNEGLTPENRILYGTRVFDINECRNFQERGIFWEIMATEQL